MTIQDALNKAVEGGYHINTTGGVATFYSGANDEYSVWTRTDNESSFIVLVQETFLDPHFWHALGRTLGWSAACDLAMRCRHDDEEYQRCRGYDWMYQWHCFIQVLAQGNAPDAYFAALTASQPMSHETEIQPKGEKAHPYCAYLLRRAEATLQHAQHICDEALGAQVRAQEIRQRSALARQRRQSQRALRCAMSEPQRVARGGVPWETVSGKAS